MGVQDLRDEIIRLPKRHDTFVGIDSDGCVFDTMNEKQKVHFHPLIISHWHLEKIADAVRACAVFSNLTSRFRGSNRFPALLRTFEFLNEYPGVRESGVELPRLDALRSYVSSDLPLGNPSLRDEVERTHDPELASLLEWSLQVNESIDTKMRPVPPFHNALRAFTLIQAGSDSMVVSQTPVAALFREWKYHQIDSCVDWIAGQEHGTKAEQLRLAADGKYPMNRVMMIGDGMGDLQAAREAGAHFYPILPAEEEESWARFCEEAYPRFLSGNYDAEYESELITDFENRLPEIPPWESPLNNQK